MRNTSELKQKNLMDIIKIIRNNGPVTKPEIAKMTNMTSVTAHNFICELVEKKLVVEVGSSKSNGGRKATLYKINEKYGYIVGQNLGRHYVSTTIFDINLNLLYINKVECSLEYSDRIISLMVEEIESAISKLQYEKKDCLGIGITVPGQVNHETGVIINLTGIPNWNSIPMKSIIENKTGLKTYVDNDNNGIAMAAKWKNIISENADAVFITIADGVGTGVLSKGKLYYGSHSYAGEIGHTTIQYNGPKCSCGGRGCIEALASDFAIIEKVKKGIKSETGINTFNDEGININTVIKLAKEGNETVYGILKETSIFVSIAIDHIVKVYDPEVIVIQSNWLGEFQDLYYFMVDNVFTRCTWAKRDNLKILVNSIDNIEVNGPASLVLERMFANIEDNLFLEKIVGIS